MMVILVVPRVEIWSEMLAFTPAPSETRAITDPIPMTIPRVVRKLLPLFMNKAFIDCLKRV
jgi:hypothetical protein